MRLHRCNQSMPDLVICHDLLFLIGKYCIFLLISCDNSLDALLEILLAYDAAAVAHGAERSFVDDICKLGA